MEYTKLFELLKDETKLVSLVTNLASGYFDVPYIISETLALLEDNSLLYNLISDSNKRSLCVMMDSYFSDCWEKYISETNLDNLLEYGKIEIYRIKAADGLRYATQGEVANGVKGLICEYIYPAGEQEYKYLCLLQWSFTGKPYFYRQAGYELQYNEDRKVTTSFYEMITKCAYELKEMFDWISVKKNYEDAISKLRKMMRKHGYKYASYARDEITEDITIKQLIYNVYKTFPRNSPNIEYRRALALSLKNYKGNKKLTPSEISWLRETYDKFALDRNRDLTQNLENKELKEVCEKIISERYSGKINQNHFAYVIIETLKKHSYSKCTSKQLKIINDAYRIITGDTYKENEKDSTEIISETEIDMSLENLSDALFDMEDEDE